MRRIPELALAAVVAASPLLYGSCARAQESRPGDSGARDGSPLQNPEQIAALLKEGNTEEALHAWARLRKSEPENLRFALGHLRALASLEKFDDAIDVGHEALRKHPRAAELLEELASAHRQKAALAARRPGSRRSALLNLREAARFAAQAFEIDATRRKSLALLGMARFQMGEVDAALETADELVRRFPKSPTGFLLRAQIRLQVFRSGSENGTLEKDERFRLAGRIRKDCSAAIRLDEERYQPHRLLGDVAAWLGETQAALDHYVQGMARNADGGAPHEWLRSLKPAFRRGCYERGIAAFRARTQTDPKDEALLQWYLGLAHFEAEDWNATRTAMARCFQLRPSFVNSLFYGALASYELGEMQHALLCAAGIAQKSPEDLIGSLRNVGPMRPRAVEILRTLAKRALDLQQVPISRELNRAIAEVAKDPDAWNNYAFLCRETGKFEESWRAYLRALELKPEDPSLLNDAAVILQYHLHRDLDRAREMYGRAVANAEKLLEEKQVPARDLARARQSLSDAKGNLKALDESQKKPDPKKDEAGKDEKSK